MNDLPKYFAYYNMKTDKIIITVYRIETKYFESSITLGELRITNLEL